MKYLFILSAAVFLSACADQVQLAKREMDASVLRQNPIQYRDVSAYSGNVVCGRFSTNLQGSEDTFGPFIYRDKRVNTRPNALDLATFCAQDPIQNFFLLTGIDLKKCGVNHLPTILNDFQTIGRALIEYEADNLEIPRQRQGLEALVSPSAIQPRPKRFRAGGYIAELPRDPWGRPYAYKGPVFGGSKGRYSLKTLGADNAVGGALENADVDSQYTKYIDHLGGCVPGN